VGNLFIFERKKCATYKNVVPKYYHYFVEILMLYVGYGFVF